MVQSKGQGKAGKASGNDPWIEDFKKDYEGARPEDRGDVKSKYQRKIKEMRKKAKELDNKEGKALRRRADQLAGAVKVITDGKVRMNAPIIFNADSMKRVLQGIPPGEIGGPDQS